MPNNVNILSEPRVVGISKRLLYEIEQVRVAFHGGELRELLFDVFRGMNEKARVGLSEHAGVVIGITGGNDVVVQSFEGGDGFAFLVRDAELIAGNLVVFHDEAMAKERGPIELADQRLGKLLESVGQNHDLGEGAKFIEELAGAFEEWKGSDHRLNIRELDAVAIKDINAVAHQLVIVRLIAGGAAELGNFGLVGDSNPDFGRQNAFHVQSNNRLFHRSAIFSEVGADAKVFAND